MGRRVAVCAVAQIKNEPDIWYQRFRGMLLDCFESIIEQTGVTFDMEKGIRDVITCSDDVFDARTISDNGMQDVVGAHSLAGARRGTRLDDRERGSAYCSPGCPLHSCRLLPLRHRSGLPVRQ